VAGAVKILFITQWFDPEPIFKGLAFARALADRGHLVEVLTGFPNYPGGRLYPGYHVSLRKSESMGGIRVTRVPLYPSHDQSAIRRVANYGSFALAAAVLGPLSVKRPDVVYAYHPPATIAIPALMLKVIRGVPFVLDIQDLWPDTLAATGMVTSRSVLAAVGGFCGLGYRSASRIVVLSPGFRRVLADRGVPAEKIDVIYNWCDETALTHVQHDAPIVCEARLNGRFNVVFAGNLGRAQALSSVLRAAKLLVEKAPRVQFVLVGEGVEAATLKAQAADIAVPNVRFLPGRPAVEVAPLLAAADVLLVHLRDDPLFSLTIPSKTQAYMAAGRPILMAVRGDAAELVTRAKCGLCCEPEAPARLAAAVEVLAAKDQEELRGLGEAGRRFYRNNLSLSEGVSSFERVFRVAAGFTPASTERGH
jgi:colanic acid biosynthesis glycosyl transferase WcaI